MGAAGDEGGREGQVVKANVNTAIARLHKTWTRSHLSLLAADLSHFHDELEDDLSGPERQEFLDMRERLGKLLADVESLLPEDGASLQRHDKATVLLTPPEHEEADDE